MLNVKTKLFVKIQLATSMDAVSLVMGTIALCNTIQTTLTNYSRYVKDADSLRLRFAAQQARLESLETVLYTPDKFAPAVKGPLIESLSENTVHVISGLVQELHFGLEQYAALKMHHEQFHDADSSSSQSTGKQEVPVNMALTLTPLPPQSTTPDRLNSVAMTKLKLTSRGRRIRWSISGRDTTLSVVEDFEGWTTRLANVIGAVLWTLPLCSTVDQFHALQGDKDAGNVGLLDGIRLRELLVTPPTRLEAHVEGLYTGAFEKLYAEGGFDVGTIHQKQGLYLIEYKTGDNGFTETISSRTREQVIKLAALLHDAPSSDEGLGVLPCTSYIEDPAHDMIGLAYALPSTYSINSLRPKTLSRLLLNPTSPKTSLNSRLRIACSIFYTVHRLHVYGWVHKSLRADNVLFLPVQPTDGGRDYNLTEPKLLGFDWARKDDEISPQEAGLDIRRNVYRHPRRWGQPSSRFHKVHDIYGEISVAFTLTFANKKEL